MADVKDTIRKAALEGASIEELQVVIAQNLDDLNDLSRDEVNEFYQEMIAAAPDTFERALFGAVTEGEARDTGLSSLLFGDPDSQIQTGVGPFGGSKFAAKKLAELGARGAIPGARDVVGGATQAVRDSGILRRFSSAIFAGIKKHPVLSTIGGGVAGVSISGLLGGDGLSNDPTSGTGAGGSQFRRRQDLSQEEIERQTIREEGFARVTSQVPENLPTGFNVMLIDHTGDITGTPGSVVIVSPKDLGLPFSGVGNPSDLAAIGATPALGGDLGVQFEETLASNLGAGSSTEDLNILQAIFPQSIGDLTIQAPLSAKPASRFSPRDPIQNREQAFAERLRTASDAQLQTPQTQIPAGAQIAPRAFNVYNSRTLLEWASISAQRNGVPLSLLYALVNHESNWNPNAVGDNGQSFGLVQIFQPAWPNISQNQSLNPPFALEWAAQKLRERFNQYGRWDAAVAAHNSPVAAEHLARTGEFKTPKSANYTQSILGSANRSGLADTVFVDGSQGDGPTVSAAGPTFAPFQTPDPAQSREYLEQTYNELLGRSPNEDEYVKGVKRIAQLSREAYNSNIRIAKGSESEAVDVGSQFTQEIKEGGEFAFHETVGQTNKFTDYAAGIARLLQQGV